MDASAREATGDYSRGRRLPSRAALPAVVGRWGLPALAAAGAVLLIVADFATLFEIRIGTVLKEQRTGGAHHGYALALLGLAALPMAAGAALGRSRPAMLALLALSVVALAVVVGIDLPDVDEEGVIGRLYEDAHANPATGFYLETLGTALLLVAAVALLALPRRARARDGRARA